MTVLYKGFSTAAWNTNRRLTSSNLELVKQDLLNHIWTKKGERVMMPDYGTRIPFMVFEPNDEDTRAIIEEDLRTVFAADPRVQLLNLNVVSLPLNNAIIAVVDLFYIELEITDVLNLEISTGN